MEKDLAKFRAVSIYRFSLVNVTLLYKNAKRTFQLNPLFSGTQPTQDPFLTLPQVLKLGYPSMIADRKQV
jgi:hypothetical protein